MTESLNLPKHLVENLAAEAARRGMSLPVLAARLSEELHDAEAHQPSEAELPLSFIGLGASSSGKTATGADEMLAQGFG